MIKPASLGNSLSSYRYPGRYGCHIHINAEDVEHALQDAHKMLQLDDKEIVTKALLQYWDDRDYKWKCFN